MALHRDIFWVGRQWAVTGNGIQAVDQKHRSQFDIEVVRLWEDGLAESLQADGWFNKEDFAKALAVARARYPEPPRKTPPPEPPREIVDLEAGAPIAPLIEPPKLVGPVDPPGEQPTELPSELAIPVEPPAPQIEPPSPVVQTFDMRVIGWPAKFLQPWRARVLR